MKFDHTSGLTSEQSRALKQLKERVGQSVKEAERNDDAMYLRYLRARDYNVNKAENMLKNTLEWREKNDIDDILTTFQHPEVNKYFPLSRLGYDRAGHPVNFLDFGHTDIAGILKSCKKEESIKCIVYHLEEDLELLHSQSEALGKPVETWNFIFDFEAYTFGQATHKASIDMLITLFQLYESHYPERLKNAFIINASLYFTILFTVVKPLLSGATLQKLRIYSKEGWREELQKVIDPEVLPKFLGGTRTDPNGDPRCPSTVKIGGLVPKSYYFRSPERRLAYQNGVKKYLVSRMSKINISLEVPESGSLIEWEFETESRDIGFGLYYQEPKKLQQKPLELVPKQRVESHLHCETGMYQCQLPGTYILMFDNSYSWLAQKEVFCRAGVITPSGDKLF